MRPLTKKVKSNENLLKIGMWNIEGLTSEKANDPHFQNIVSKLSIASFVETCRDVFVAVVYISPEYSSYNDNDIESVYSILLSEVEKYSSMGDIIIQGDFNAYTNTQLDFIEFDNVTELVNLDDSEYHPDRTLSRNNLDHKHNNNSGKLLLNMCKEIKIRILNDQTTGDLNSQPTCITYNGSSLVDYTLCTSEELIDSIGYFVVHDFSSLSNHRSISCAMFANFSSVPCDLHKLDSLPGKFLWTDEAIASYTENMRSQMFKDKFANFIAKSFNDSDSITESFNLILLDCAKQSAKLINKKPIQKLRKSTRKPWFSHSCINSLVLRYINERKVWKDAVAHCDLLNGSLLSITEEELHSLVKCHILDTVEFPLWTGYIEFLSEWIETNHCYTSDDIHYKWNVTIGESVTPYECQQYCKGAPLFTQGPHGGCFCDVTEPHGAADRQSICDLSFQHRLYRVLNDSSITYSTCYGEECKCVYPKCDIGNGNSCNDDNDNLYAADCDECRDVRCQIDTLKENSLSWIDGMLFCNGEKSMLRIPGILFKEDDYTWIGISRRHVYIHSMYLMANGQNVKPTTCFTISHDFMVRKSDCGIQRNFFCKIDVDDRRNDDYDVLFTSQTPEKSIVQTELKRTTCNQITTTKGTYIHSSTMYSTTPTTTTQNSLEVSIKDDNSSNMTTIIGAVIGSALIIIIASVLLIFTMIQRNGKLCRNSENSVKQKRNEESNDISSIKLNNININNKRSDCYSYAAYEEDSVPVIKQEGNQRHNPMFDPSGLQEVIRPCGIGDKSKHLYEDNRSYKNEFEFGTRDEQDYGDYNLSNTNASIPNQNLYDSSVGIYNHINHGSTRDHMEETYDHFNGSEQDYDQIDNKRQRANASSEYS
ncbi:unnamed protein product [Mytilus coruscus]|uniref:C-type lectin domain-containing protein n=1 Tax=Mytilus coruscus TaxID=42192 RepID=A0A6J8D5X9_MYTCO|nr:unnamed protein product [Mytilus coruscus]